MLTIHLHKLLFHCFHGLHEEEKLVGGDFEVNLSVSYIPSSSFIKKIDETVNYVALYELVKVRMKQPTELLETIATELAAEIFEKFMLIEAVDISIRKLHPPIIGFQGSVAVNYSIKRDQ